MSLTLYTPLIVNAAKVPSAQTDFAMLINITDARFKTVANGGHVQNPNGYDIRPFLDYTLTTTPLTYFLLRYNGATGEVIMRVKVPSLTGGMLVCLGCGDATLTTDGSSAATFSNNFLGVYPFGNGTTLSMADATGTNNATNHGATAGAGQVDGCAVFNGTSQYIDLGSVFNPVALTYSALVKGVAWTNAYNAIIVRVNAGNAIYTMFFVKSNGKLSAWAMGTSSVSADGTGPTTIATGTWYHLAMTYDSVNGLKAYINGVLELSVAASGALNTTAIPTNIGNDTINVNRFLNGSIQQLHVSSVARAASWIAVEANQTLSPATFLDVGGELPAGTAPFTITGLSPACGSNVRGTQDFVVSFSHAVQVASLAASDFTVNGTPANSVTNTGTTATFHFNTSPILNVSPSTPQPVAIATGAILRNSDAVGNLAFGCNLFYSPWVANLLYVPCKTGTGATVNVPDAALWGRRFRPQPFMPAGISNPELWGDFVMPDGFANVAYLSEWYCENQNQPVTYTLLSGALPTGTALTNVGSPPTARGRLSGTPTAQGAFTFTLRATGPTVYGDKSFTVNIGPAPASGAGGVGGG
jgi:hypothetical protein